MLHLPHGCRIIPGKSVVGDEREHGLNQDWPISLFLQLVALAHASDLPAAVQVSVTEACHEFNQLPEWTDMY